MLGGPAGGRIGSRRAGGLGFLLLPVRCVSVFGFLAFLLLLELLFLQALSFCIVGLALGDLSAG